MSDKTKAAREWIATMRRFATPEALDLVVERANDIRKRRRAPRLGKLHLEIALAELAEPEEMDRLNYDNDCIADAISY